MTGEAGQHELDRNPHKLPITLCINILLCISALILNRLAQPFCILRKINYIYLLQLFNSQHVKLLLRSHKYYLFRNILVETTQAYTSPHKIRGGQKSTGDCRQMCLRVWDVTAIQRT